MTAQGAFGDKRASVIDCLFNAVGYRFAVFRNLSPDIENIGFRKRRENIGGHRLGERPSRHFSFMT
jgi:hypothetical protein